MNLHKYDRTLFIIIINSHKEKEKKIKKKREEEVEEQEDGRSSKWCLIKLWTGKINKLHCYLAIMIVTL